MSKNDVKNNENTNQNDEVKASFFKKACTAVKKAATSKPGRIIGKVVIAGVSFTLGVAVGKRSTSKVSTEGAEAVTEAAGDVIATVLDGDAQ